MLVEFPSNLLFFISIIAGVVNSNNHTGKLPRLVEESCYTLHVTNDGPVTLDVPVSVTATLACADPSVSFVYVFEDEEGRKIEIESHQSATAVFIYTEDIGLKSVQVTAYLVFPVHIPVATSRTYFDVYEYIPGTLNFTNISDYKDGNKYAATGQETNISLYLKYPPHVLQSSEFAYSWTFASHANRTYFTTNEPFKVHQFNNTGPQWIRVAVVGRIQSNYSSSGFRYKWGYFDEDIIVKDPFRNINISGNTYLEHGQLLNLDISCNGSGPVEYCWKILPPSKNNTNLNCTEPDVAEHCSFPILYYFRDSGNFVLAIQVSNVVASLQRKIEVHIYDVSLRPQLSTVIIPVVSICLVILIIAGAVVVHRRLHPGYGVETANFDFMQPDENSAINIETPWQMICRSLLRLLHIRCLCHSNDSVPNTVNYGTVAPNKSTIHNQ